ncbi:MAG: hypothetical protein WEI16_01250, partial [Chloroflexota bacterium]
RAFGGRLASVRAVDSFVPLGTATAAVLVGLDHVVAAAVRTARSKPRAKPTRRRPRSPSGSRP